MNQPQPLSSQLPFDIRAALARAAATPVTDQDPNARVKAIDKVMERARSTHPQLFRRQE